jgi:DNA-binding transcriptional LysR family regulator
VTNLEAVAFLILAGTHIGFMPQHYAASWVERGEMRALLPDEFRRESDLAVITQASAQRTPVLKHFLSAIEANTSDGPM